MILHKCLKRNMKGLHMSMVRSYLVWVWLVIFVTRARGRMLPCEADLEDGCFCLNQDRPRVFCDYAGLTHFPDLREVSHAWAVSITHNSISAINRTSLHYLKKVKILSLESNAIADIQPGSLSGLADHLERLDLSNNQLKAVPLEVSILIHLRWLNLKNNLITALWIIDFNVQFELKVLDLQGNKLNRIQDGTFRNLEQLNELSLTLAEDFYGNLEINLRNLVAPLKNLTALSIVNTKIAPDYFGFISNLQNLKYLVLNNTYLGFAQRGVFGNLPRIEVISLENCNIEQSVFNLQLGNFRSTLTHLSLTHDHFTTDDYLAVGGENMIFTANKMEELQFLDMSYNRITVLASRPWANLLTYLPKLEQLVLRGNRVHSIQGDVSKVLLSIPGMLDLQDNQLSTWDVPNKALKDLPGTLTLKLEGNPLSCRPCSLHWLTRTINEQGGAFHVSSGRALICPDGSLVKDLPTSITLKPNASLNHQEFSNNIHDFQCSDGTVPVSSGSSLHCADGRRPIYIYPKDGTPPSQNSLNMTVKCNATYLDTGKKNWVTVPSGVKYLYNLETLNLLTDSITHLDEHQFEYLSNLETLNLEGNPITSFHEDTFKGLSCLNRLSITLKNKDIQKENFAGLFIPIKQIKSLDIFNSTFPLDLLILLEDLKDLERFTIHATDLSELKSFPYFGKLQYLSLQYDHLSNVSALHLDTIPTTLTYISLAYNNITEMVPLGEHNLEYLSLYNNSIGALNKDVSRGLLKVKDTLILCNNNLTKWRPRKKDVSNIPFGLEMCLSGNPWNCNSCSIHWLMDSRILSSKHIMAPNDLKCSNGEKVRGNDESEYCGIMKSSCALRKDLIEARVEHFADDTLPRYCERYFDITMDD